MSRLTLFAPCFFGPLLAVTGVLRMTGRLPENDWFGIRMHVVMSSDAAWLAGHRAGGPWLLAGGFVALAAGVTLLIVRPDAAMGARIVTVSRIVAFLLAGVAAWRTQAAARPARAAVANAHPSAATGTMNVRLSSAHERSGAARQGSARRTSKKEQENMADPFRNTPPAPEDKGVMTAQNIAAALAGESQASQKYLAFADVADAESYPNVARLFRAVAYAESTHARNHLSVLGGIGTTTENVKAAWSGETFEIDEMYPAYNAVAKLQENKSAQTSIRYALKAEMDHQGIYDSTLKGVEGKEDLAAEPVRVCPICGHTVIGDAPDECPQCGTAGSYFKEF